MCETRGEVGQFELYLTFEKQSVKHVRGCGKSELADQHAITLSEASSNLVLLPQRRLH